MQQREPYRAATAFLQYCRVRRYNPWHEHVVMITILTTSSIFYLGKSTFAYCKNYVQPETKLCRVKICSIGKIVDCCKLAILSSLAPLQLFSWFSLGFYNIVTSSNIVPRSNVFPAVLGVSRLKSRSFAKVN